MLFLLIMKAIYTGKNQKISDYRETETNLHLPTTYFSTPTKLWRFLLT